jgi:hypothetical protein
MVFGSHLDVEITRHAMEMVHDIDMVSINK